MACDSVNTMMRTPDYIGNVAKSADGVKDFRVTIPKEERGAHAMRFWLDFVQEDSILRGRLEDGGLWTGTEGESWKIQDIEILDTRRIY